MRPRIFVSAVTEEFGSLRREVCARLTTLGFEAVSQDNAPTGYGTLPDWLHRQIDRCKGFVQIVGNGYGAEPPTADPTLGRASYTQLEFARAIAKRKKTWLFLADVDADSCRDLPTHRLDLPVDGSVDATEHQRQRRALQDRYREHLQREKNRLCHSFATRLGLDNLVLRMRDDLAQIRSQDVFRYWITATGSIAVFGLAVYVARSGIAPAMVSAADRTSFEQASNAGCDGLRAFVGDPRSHPALVGRAQALLGARTTVRTEVWEPETNRTRRVEVGFGRADVLPTPKEARAASLELLEATANQDCLDATASDEFRLPQGRAPSRLDSPVFHCEPLGTGTHCAADALARCQLDVRRIRETEVCAPAGSPR